MLSVCITDSLIGKFDIRYTTKRVTCVKSHSNSKQQNALKSQKQSGSSGRNIGYLPSIRFIKQQEETEMFRSSNYPYVTENSWTVNTFVCNNKYKSKKNAC